MNANNVTIDSLNIRLPRGWQGEPVYLARKISRQIQQQSPELTGSKQIDLKVTGNFASDASRVSREISKKLSATVAAKHNLSGDGT